MKIRLLRGIAALVLWCSLAGIWDVPTARAAFEPGSTAVVVTTDGDLLTVRSGPGRGYGAITALGTGTTVGIVDGPFSDDEGILWYQVSAWGTTGWCAAEWLATSAAAIGNQYVSNTGGGLNLRAEPAMSSEILLIIPDGGAVQLLGGEGYADDLAWSLVRYAGISGWVASVYLNGTSAGSGGVAASPTLTGGTLTVGENAQVVGTDGFDLRVRDGIGTTAPIFTTVPANTVITIVNGPLADENGAPWYGIGYDGLFGWAAGQYLMPTSAPATPRINPGDGLGGFSTEPAVSNPIRGQAITALALQYLGTPYVWGGDTPAGWDCSGMIQWIYLQAAGVQLPRISQVQWYYGTRLRPSEIEAGDIIFFYDTDGPGITHNGIALGDGRFIHARDASRGTVISWLDEPFWTAHYAGARRP